MTLDGRIVTRSAKVAVVIVLACATSAHCQDLHTAPDSGQVTSPENHDTPPVEETIEALRQALDADPKSADGWYKLARLLMSQGPDARQEADRCLRQAIQLDPENSEYQIALGGLLFAKGFFYNAAQHFEELEEKNPGNAKASYWIGYYAVGEYLHEKDMRGGENPLKKLWADADLDKAVAYLEESIKADPHSKDSYYQLGLLALENGRPEGLLEIARDLLRVFPNDKDALSFCGLAYTSMSSFARADSCFSLGLSAMGPEERAIMESVELVMPDLDTGETATDTSSFWTASDPLYLSDYNERRLEHYSRVAYANLRFSVFWKNVEGWRTDLGKSYIKFGRYTSRTTSVGFAGGWQERWSYGPFTLQFRSALGVADWSAFSHDSMARSRKVFESTDSRYVDPYRSVRYSLPTQAVVYKKADGDKLSCSFALPLDSLVTTANGILLDEGVFVFDENWRPLLTKRRPVVLRYQQDSAGDTQFFVSERSFVLPKGATHLAVEVADKTGKKIGSVRQDLNTRFEEGLHVTEPLFAHRIDPLGTELETIADLSIDPNPLRAYRRGDRVHIAFEIYNLQRDSFGQSPYEVAYELGPPNSDLNASHFRAIGLEPKALDGEAERITRVQAEYVATRGDEVTYLSVDPGPLPEGIYSLRIIVKDKTTGDSVAVASHFGILETPPTITKIDSDYSVLDSVSEGVNPADAKEALERLDQGKTALAEYIEDREFRISSRLSKYGSDVKMIDDPRKAIRLLEKAIDLNPGLAEAYHYLALLELEKGDPSDALKVCGDLLTRNPNNTYALLLSGLAAERLGKLAEAAEYIKMAENTMRPSERRAIYGSVDLLTRKSKLVDKFPGWTSKTWIRSRELDEFWNAFWKPLDPLYLTEFNERLVAHFGRFVYADLRFQQAKGLRGSDTDFGRAWIKFGPYVAHTTDGLISSSRSEATTSSWRYGAFKLDFWKSSGRDNEPSTMRVDELSLQRYPAQYADPYRSRKYSMPYQISAFREKDSLRVELSYATLRETLKGKRDNYNITKGVFAFDRDWKELLSDVRDVDIKWPKKTKAREPNDRGDHLIGVQTLNVTPGTYHFAVEVADKLGDRISSFRSTRDFGFDKDLAISDLLLATEISPLREPVLSREDLSILPNPARYFTPDTPIQFYFEIYNLTKDEFGRTRYRITYEISKPTGTLDPGRFAVMAESELRRFEKDLENTLSAARDQVQSVEAEYEGDGRDDFTYLTIDVSQIPSGIYQLNVEIRDVTSNQTSSRSTLLRVDHSSKGRR